MFRFVPLAFSALFLAAPSLRAGEKPAPVQESAEAVLVEVPVRVIGRDGKPVRNLTTTDFDLYDDGRKQDILAFDTIDLAQKGIAPGASESVNPAARRHFLLLFDLSFASPKAVLAARRAAKEFVLNGMGDRDFAAVATFSVEKGVRLLVTFSNDRVQLARAIDTLGLTDPNSLHEDPLSFVYDVMRIEGADDPGGAQRSERLSEGQAAGLLEALQTMASLTRARLDDYQRTRVARLTESLSEAAKALDSVQGRKDIIYLSEGFEGRLLFGADESEQEHEWKLTGEQWKVDADKTYGNSNLQAQIQTMSALFRRSDCVIHAVDIAGLQTDSDSSYRGMQGLRGENALFEIASGTGGEVLRNDNDFRAQLERLIAQTNLVYVLSFRPKRTGRENHFHALTVKVRARGARVLARAGYYERRAFRTLSPLERNLLAADVLANEVPVREIPARVMASALPGGQGPACVPVLVEIPGPALLAGQKGPWVSAEIYVYARDTEDRLRDFFAQTVNVDLAKNRARLEEGGLRYYGQLTLAPGEYRLRVLVRNGETGRMGLVAEPLRVPDLAEKRPYLAPPVFLGASPEGIFVRGRVGAASRSDSGPELVLAATGEDLLPSALPELRDGSPARVSVMAYNFGEPRAQALKIGAQVLSEEGRPLKEGAIRVLGQSREDADGKQVLLVSFTPTELAPGRYSLRVFLQDGVSGRAGYSSTPFLVR